MATETPSPNRLASRLIFGFALLGLLVVTHLWIQTKIGFTRGCFGLDAPTGEIAECGKVVGSDSGSVLGVSNVLFGFLFYGAIAGMRLWMTRAAAPLTGTLRRFSAAITGAGFVYSLYLFYQQAAVLDAWCKLCLISAGIVTILFVLHLWEARGGDVPAAPRADFKPFAAALAVVVLLAATDAIVFRQLGREAAAASAPVTAIADLDVPAGCGYDNELQRLRTPFAYVNADDPHVGADDAPVVLVKFFDPNCPHCKTMHGLLEQTLPGYAEQARLYYAPYPIWSYSVPQVQAMYVAREEGKFFEMLDAQFAAQKQGGFNIGELMDMAESIGMDPDAFRAKVEGGAYREKVQQEKAAIDATGINSVPKLAINGQFLSNTGASWTPACIGGLIEHEAKQLTGAAFEDAASGS